MFKAIRFSAALILLVWLGVTVTLTFYVAPSLFANESGVVPNSSVAGEIMGPLLNKMYLTGRILLPLCLILTGILWASANPNRRKPLLVAGLLLVAALGIDLYAGIPLNREIHSIRLNLDKEFGGYHLAPKENPDRQSFAKLHGLSMVLVLVNLGLGLGAFFCVTQLAEAGASRGAVLENSAPSSSPQAALPRG